MKRLLGSVLQNSDPCLYAIIPNLFEMKKKLARKRYVVAADAETLPPFSSVTLRGQYADKSIKIEKFSKYVRKTAYLNSAVIDHVITPSN